MAKAPSPEVVELSKELFDKINIKDGKPTIDKDTYVASLPVGLTTEQLELLNKHNSIFFPAVSQAFGEKAITAMAKDKKLDHLTLEVPLVGNNHYDIKMDRSRQYHNPKNPEEQITKYGTFTAQLVTVADDVNRNEFKTVKELLSEMALELLGNCK